MNMYLNKFYSVDNDIKFQFTHIKNADKILITIHNYNFIIIVADLCSNYYLASCDLCELFLLNKGALVAKINDLHF